MIVAFIIFVLALMALFLLGAIMAILAVGVSQGVRDAWRYWITRIKYRL